HCKLQAHRVKNQESTGMPNRLAQIIQNTEGALLSDWVAQQNVALGSRNHKVSESELRVNAHDFVLALRQGLARGDWENLAGESSSGMRQMLANLSRQRASQGFSPSETATFVFSFKRVLFDQLRQAGKLNGEHAAEDMMSASELLDKLGLFTMEVYQKTR